MNKAEILQLKKYGYKLTSQRETIWDILSNVKGHITPQALHSLIIKKYPEIGLVTVYRTLSIFSEAGLFVKWIVAMACIIILFMNAPATIIPIMNIIITIIWSVPAALK